MENQTELIIRIFNEGYGRSNLIKRTKQENKDLLSGLRSENSPGGWGPELSRVTFPVLRERAPSSLAR